MNDLIEKGSGGAIWQKRLPTGSHRRIGMTTLDHRGSVQSRSCPHWQEERSRILAKDWSLSDSWHCPGCAVCWTVWNPRSTSRWWSCPCAFQEKTLVAERERWWWTFPAGQCLAEGECEIEKDWGRGLGGGGGVRKRREKNFSVICKLQSD